MRPAISEACGPLTARAAAANQNHQHDFRMRLIGVGNEPAEAPAERFVVARAGLAESLFAIGIVALLRSAVHHGGEHAFAQIGQQRRDIQLLAHARLKILARFFRARILQVILRAAVRQSGNQRSELQRREADAFAETGHARNAAVRRRRGGHETGLLFGNIVTGALAQADQSRVLMDARETEARADLFKINVVGMRHRFGEVHVTAMAHLAAWCRE